MRILDLYILRRFVMILLYALLVFISIVIFVDMVGNLAKFIDKNVPYLIITKYYLFFIPYLFILVLPAAMLLASLFGIGQVARCNELIAMTSVGISLNRILLPLLLLSIFVSLVALVFGEMMVPQANHEKSKIKNEYLEPSRKHIKSRITNIYWRDKLDRRIFINYYDTREKTAHKVSIQIYDENQIVERLDAPTMTWQDSIWVLVGGYKRSFSGNTEQAIPFDTLKDNNIDFKPEQLAQTQKGPEDMSYAELNNFIQEVERNGGNVDLWLVDLYLKISFPFASFVMVLFGAPLASNKRSGGVIAGFIISLIICFIYFGFVKFIQTLGHAGTLSPLLSAWLPNGIFFACGGILLFKTKT
ncbi:MAG: LPS export ABC transporter permease LptG [bacterium]